MSTALANFLIFLAKCFGPPWNPFEVLRKPPWDPLGIHSGSILDSFLGCHSGPCFPLFWLSKGSHFRPCFGDPQGSIFLRMLRETGSLSRAHPGPSGGAFFDVVWGSRPEHPGVPWGSALGPLGVQKGAFGGIRRRGVGIVSRSWGHTPAKRRHSFWILGRSWWPTWLPQGFQNPSKIDDSSCHFLAWFFDGFWMAPGCILGVFLMVFWKLFLLFFPSLAKMANPTKPL